MEWHPLNADPARTRLNRELVEGEGSRDERIGKRIGEAGIGKLKKNQVRALTLVMSASSEDMSRIMAGGRLNDWCEASVRWARETHGEENVVSAVLHMDEKTPHLHVTVVPIACGKSRDQAYRERKDREAGEKGVPRKKKRKYKKKGLDAPRLCAADFMSRERLKEYQTSYAQAMAEFGLERGREGSRARHIDTGDWYKQQQEEQLEEERRARQARIAEIAQEKAELASKAAEEEKRKKALAAVLEAKRNENNAVLEDMRKEDERKKALVEELEARQREWERRVEEAIGGGAVEVRKTYGGEWWLYVSKPDIGVNLKRKLSPEDCAAYFRDKTVTKERLATRMFLRKGKDEVFETAKRDNRQTRRFNR